MAPRDRQALLLWSHCVACAAPSGLGFSRIAATWYRRETFLIAPQLKRYELWVLLTLNVRLDDYNVHLAIEGFKTAARAIKWRADFDKNGEVRLTRANYSHVAIVKNDAGEECYAI